MDVGKASAKMTHIPSYANWGHGMGDREGRGLLCIELREDNYVGYSQ